MTNQEIVADYIDEAQTLIHQILDPREILGNLLLVSVDDLKLLNQILAEARRLVKEAKVEGDRQ